jgi:hypothetical protein
MAGLGVASAGVVPAAAGTAGPYDEFVVRSYHDILDRDPDAPSFETWTSELEGGLHKTDYAFALLRSGEFGEVLVNSFYNQYLEREADPGGLVGFGPLIDGGTSWEHVQSLLLGSDEFFALAGNNNDNFIAGLYFLLLDRAPDEDGFGFWFDRLNEGWSRQMVAEQVALSPEARSLLIDNIYNGILGRSVDDAALDVWVVSPYETVLIAILASDEYFNFEPPPIKTSWMT